MRYFKFSILAGMGLFALAMFFLSQSIQGFLSINQDAEQTPAETELEISLSEPDEFPDLSLDFPAGPNQSPVNPAPAPKLSSIATDQKLAQERRLLNNLPENRTPDINLVTASSRSADSPPALNILLLSQTTKEQRTTLIEELVRIDADLVRQVAMKPADQQDITANEVKTVQQISLTNPFPKRTVSAGYAVPQTTMKPASAPEPFLVQQERLVHIIAAYRGITFKTTGIPTQDAALNQTIPVIPFITNTMLPATVISKNLVQLDLHSQLPVPRETQAQPVLKLAQLGEFQPAEIIKLTGSGLVVGLNGTGERNYSPEAIQALKSSMAAMNINVKQIKTPLRTGNLANVSLIAYIPNQGVKKGQRIECYLTAANPDVKLTGGYLLPTTIQQTGAPAANAIVMGMLQTNQTQNKSQAIIEQGAELLSDITPRLVSGTGIPHLKFFLNDSASLPATGQLIAQTINQFLKAQQNLNAKAMLQSTSMIMISLPHPNQKLAQQLAAHLLKLSIPIQPSLAQSSLVKNQTPELMIDQATATIQTRGNVLLQPTQLEFNDLILEISSSGTSATPRLNDLLALMHHLKFPKPRQIEFLRGLQQQGKIKAAYHEQ
ncbi:flagellar basal body P-ring protein FlgI [Gimesia fumaroli]|uniref:Flagellar basal body P-ring protein n=1 Tax=Gimesia fumaroli TaxID=2527976 RepID=A0A518I8P8_9PLAN|nr:flagellar basal body P-ring protein FlgI [Gimesia fumaroli]QDV49471.1 flagellar basal body P-ring protein [Gimesia fumaroli]